MYIRIKTPLTNYVSHHIFMSYYYYFEMKRGWMKIEVKLYIADGEKQQKRFTNIESGKEAGLQMLQPYHHHLACNKQGGGLGSYSKRFETLGQWVLLFLNLEMKLIFTVFDEIIRHPYNTLWLTNRVGFYLGMEYNARADLLFNSQCCFLRL